MHKIFNLAEAKNRVKEIYKSIIAKNLYWDFFLTK